MNRKLLWTALFALFAPILLRTVWYFPGFSNRPAIATPDYASMTIPNAPVDAKKVEKAKSLGGVVVIDQAHSNQFQPNEIESLIEAVSARGGSVEFVSDTTSLATRLKYAKAYVLISPSYAFTDEELTLLHGFTDNGGKILVFTDATRGIISVDFFTGNTTQFPDVNAVNPLLEKYDIRVNNDYLYNLNENEGNFRNIYFKDFGKSELTFGLKEVVLYGAHSIKSNSGLVLFQGAETTLSSITDATPSKESTWSGAVLSEDESTAVFGDFTFLTTPFNSVASNQSLIANLADFMLDHDRKPSLVNYPYIFQQNSISLLPTSDVQMTAEMISALSRFQSSFKSMGVDIQIVDRTPRKGDLIVLGTYAENDATTPTLESFDLTIDSFDDFITLPKLGKVGKTGNGLILFEQGYTENTITLLADTTTDLIALLERTSGKELYDCVISEDIGICSIGYGGDFSSEPPVIETPEFTATETPGG